MLPYKKILRRPARILRNNMTDAEKLLWSKLRKKQILEIQFYRQKPIGIYIVDFYAPKVKIVIEVDGSQHSTENGIAKDAERDLYLSYQGLKILRFSNLEVLKNIDSVIQVIWEQCLQLLPLKKGGREGFKTPK